MGRKKEEKDTHSGEKKGKERKHPLPVQCASAVVAALRAAQSATVREK